MFAAYKIISIIVKFRTSSSSEYKVYKSNILNRFLSEQLLSIKSNDSVSLNKEHLEIDSLSDHDASQEIQEILNQSTSDMCNLTLDDVKSCFKDTNPFIEDALQAVSIAESERDNSGRKNDAFKVFQSVQNGNDIHFFEEMLLEDEDESDEGKNIIESIL